MPAARVQAFTGLNWTPPAICQGSSNFRNRRVIPVEGIPSSGQHQAKRRLGFSFEPHQRLGIPRNPPYPPDSFLHRQIPLFHARILARLFCNGCSLISLLMTWPILEYIKNLTPGFFNCHGQKYVFLHRKTGKSKEGDYCKGSDSAAAAGVRGLKTNLWPGLERFWVAELFT